MPTSRRPPARRTGGCPPRSSPDHGHSLGSAPGDRISASDCRHSVSRPIAAARLKAQQGSPDDQGWNMGGSDSVLADPADPTPNRRRIGRSLGMLFLIEGTLGEAWLLLPHDGGQPLPLVLICVLAQLVGVWLRRGAVDEAPLWVLKAIVAFATLMAVAACVLSGSDRTGFAFLFLWVTPYAVYFGLRHAILQTGLAVIGLVGSRIAIAD